MLLPHQDGPRAEALLAQHPDGTFTVARPEAAGPGPVSSEVRGERGLPSLHTVSAPAPPGPAR